MSGSTHGPELPTLYTLFRPEIPPPVHEVVAAEAVPEPYRRLLVHAEHMTVTVEAFYNSLVNVRVLESRRDGDVYARKILLTLQSDGRVVLFGIIRVHL